MTIALIKSQEARPRECAEMSLERPDRFGLPDVSYRRLRT